MSYNGYKVLNAADLDKGKYKLVIAVNGSAGHFNNDNIKNNVWDLCILGPDNTCVEKSLKGFPDIGSTFYDPCFGRVSSDYILTIYEGDFEFCQKMKKVLQATPKLHQELKEELNDLSQPKIIGTSIDYCWWEEAGEFNTWPDDTPKEQTEDQRIAQKHVDLNKAKIAKLEKELKDLRELQKFLKKQR